MFKPLIAITLAGTAAFAFHTELKSSMPAKNQVVAASPAKVTLTFTEGVNAGVSTISIQKPDSTLVEKLTVKGTSDKATIEGAVTKPLAAGRYLVRYKTASDDGHAVPGFYAFTVSPAK